MPRSVLSRVAGGAVLLLATLLVPVSPHADASAVPEWNVTVHQDSSLGYPNGRDYSLGPSRAHIILGPPPTASSVGVSMYLDPSSWEVGFWTPTPLVPGYYVDADSNPEGTSPRITFSGFGGGNCYGQSKGWFVISAYDRGLDGSIRYLRATWGATCPNYPAASGSIVIDQRSAGELGVPLEQDITALSFPNTPWPAGSASKNVVISNPGPNPVTLGAAFVSGPAFHVTADSCDDAPLASGTSCTVSVNMDTGLPGAQQDHLFFPNNAGFGTLPVSLTGSTVFGTLPVARRLLELDGDPGSIFDGDVLEYGGEGEPAIAATASRFYVGGGASKPNAVEIAVDADHRLVLALPAGQTMTPGTYHVSLPLYLNPNDGPALGLHWDPLPECGRGIGDFTVYAVELAPPDDRVVHFVASFTFHCIGSTAQIRGMVVIDDRSAEHVAVPLTTDVTSLDLTSSLVVGEPVTKQVLVTNPSGVAVHLGTAAIAQGAEEAFSIVADSCTGATLAPAATCTVDVAFASFDERVQPAQLVLANDAGYFAPHVALRGSATLGDIGELHSLPPTTMMDSVTGVGRPATSTAKLVMGMPEVIDAHGKAGLPNSGISAVLAQVTVDKPGGAGTLNFSVPGLGPSWASETGRSMTFAKSATVTSIVVVPVLPDGRFRLLPTVAMHLRIDIIGYFGDGTGSPGLRISASHPKVVVDTQRSIGTVTGLVKKRLTSKAVAVVQLPADTGAFILTTTASNAAQIKVWPVGRPEPVAGWIAVPGAETRSTLVMSPPGPSTQFNIRLSKGTTLLTVNRVGRFLPGGPQGWAGRTLTLDPAPVRVIEWTKPAKRLPKNYFVNHQGFPIGITVRAGETKWGSWVPAGIVGAFSTHSTTGAGPVLVSDGSENLALTPPQPESFRSRSGKQASGLVLTPTWRLFSMVVFNRGGPTYYAFDEMAFIVGDFLGYLDANGKPLGQPELPTEARWT